MRILFVGLGQFGFALLSVIQRNKVEADSRICTDVDQGTVDGLRENRKHPVFFSDSDVALREDISVVSIDEAFSEQSVQGVDVVFLCVPSFALVSTLERLQPFLSPGIILCNVAKALSGSAKPFSQEIESVLSGLEYSYVMLAGGMIASDLIAGYPLGCTLAGEKNATRTINELFEGTSVECEQTQDILGTEYAGACKNICAISCGYLHEKYGYGTVTHFLTKVTKDFQQNAGLLGVNPDTFSATSQCRGNDGFMSCTGPTRNNRFGRLLAQGMSFDEAVGYCEEQNITVEGIKTYTALKQIEGHPLHQFIFFKKFDSLVEGLSCDR